MLFGDTLLSVLLGLYQRSG